MGRIHIKMVTVIFFLGNWIIGNFLFLPSTFYILDINMYFIYNIMLLNMNQSGFWSMREITWADRK